MRILLLLGLVAVLMLVSAAQAQETDLPSCTRAEIDAVHASLAKVTEFSQRTSEIRSMDDLLAYSQTHIEWREGYWTNTPLCAESFEIALLANQLIGDLVAFVLVNSLQDDVEANPYRAGRKSGIVELQALMNFLPPPINTADLPAAGRPQGCTDTEFEFVSYTLLPEYSDLADIANDVETVEDFLGYVDAQLAWRQGSLTRYPPCAEALEFAWLASQTAGDIAALFAYYFIGAPEDEIPYSQPERQGSRRLGELADALRAGALPDEVMRAIKRELGNPGGGNWRRCSAEELETIQNLLPTYQMLEDMAGGIETLDDLVAYSQAQIVWRENLPAKLTRCGEVLEVAWLISESIGDLAIMYALKLLDIPVDESPVFQQVMSNVAGIDTWKQILPSLLESYEQQDGVSALPACTEEELDALAAILFEHLTIFKNMDGVRSIDDLMTLIIQQLAWREFSFSHLPLCYGSLETFLRAYWFASDNAVGVALELAGLPEDANPYWEQLTRNKAHIESWYAIVEGVVDPPSADIAADASE